MDHEQIKEALSLYAIDALDPTSAHEVAAHLAEGCSRCGPLLKQYEATAGLLPYALAPKAPPASLKTRLMAALSDPAAAATMGAQDGTLSPPLKPTPPLSLRPDQPARRQHWWSTPSPALAATLGGLLLGAGAYALYLQANLETERESASLAKSTLAQTASRIAELTRQMEQQKSDMAHATQDSQRAVDALRATHDLLAKNQEQLETLQAAQKGRAPKGGEDLARILSSPAVRMTALSGTDMAKDAYAMVFVEPGAHKGFFYAANLPAPPAGKTYQLWAITDKPVSAGVFSLDPARKGHMMMRDMPEVARIKQFAVSLEPEGGRPQPTGSIYLAGAL